MHGIFGCCSRLVLDMAAFLLLHLLPCQQDNGMRWGQYREAILMRAVAFTSSLHVAIQSCDY